MHDASSCDQFPVLQYVYPLSALCENKMPCVSFDHLYNLLLCILKTPMATALHDERLSTILTAILQQCKQTTKTNKFNSHKPSVLFLIYLRTGKNWTGP